MPRSSPYLHALLITGLVFLLIGALRLITFNIHYFDPFNNGIRDYEITDLLASQFRDPERAKRETRVVLVHVERPDRTELAETIRRIAEQQPAAIGVDILFAGRKTPRGDSLLSASLAAANNLVLAANLKAYDDEKGGIDGLITSDPLFATYGEHAYTNFLAGTDRTVRLFNPTYTTLDGTKQKSFALALTEHLHPGAAARLRNRDSRPVRIHYAGSHESFLQIPQDTVLATRSEEALKLFRDRIVIIGYIDSEGLTAPLQDRYFTPLNAAYTGRSLPDMYGAVIHANIISMVLDGTYVREVPGWLEACLIVAFTYLNVLTIHRIYYRLPDSFHGVTRILQLVEFFIFFFLVALAYYYFRLKIDFRVGFLALLLAYDVVMIYESFIRKRVPGLRHVNDA